MLHQSLFGLKFLVTQHAGRLGTKHLVELCFVPQEVGLEAGSAQVLYVAHRADINTAGVSCGVAE